MANNPLYTTHVKLLAFDLTTLTQSPTNPPTFSRNGIPLSRAETVGTVTSREHKPNRYLKFTVDDGTGCIPCILWLNHLTSPYFAQRNNHNPESVRFNAHVANHHASLVVLGSVVRVRGRITGYRGAVQITVSDVVAERDPNVEILHWLDCINLARKVYDQPLRICNSSK